MRRLLLFALSALALIGCTPEAKTPSTPVITIDDISVVTAEGGQGQITFSIANPIDGATISASTTESWITNFEYPTTQTITFSVAANDNIDTRTGNITLSYEGAVDVVATLSQEQLSYVVNNTADAVDNTVNTLSASIIAALGEDHSKENIIVTGTMNNADFASLTNFVNIDLSRVEIVGTIKNLLNPEQTNSIPTFGFHELDSEGRPISINSTLKTLKLPNSIVELSAGSLGQCMALEEVRMPDELKFIQTQAFFQCLALKRVTNWGKIEIIGSRAFSDCQALEALELPSTITTLEAGAFSGCITLTEVILPESMTTITGNVFAANSAMTSFSAPEHLDFSAADYCFFNTALTSYTFNSATAVVPPQFLMSTKLTELDIPATITTIDNDLKDDKLGSFANIPTLTKISVHWTDNIPAVDSLHVNPDTFNLPEAQFVGTFPEGYGTVAAVGEELSQYSIEIPSGTMDKYLATPGWNFYNLIERTN